MGERNYYRGGRPKGAKNKRNNRNSTANTSNGSTLDKYNIRREWEKRLSKRVEDIHDIEYYIYNDIPLEEYYNKIENKDEDMQDL